MKRESQKEKRKFGVLKGLKFRSIGTSMMAMFLGIIIISLGVLGYMSYRTGRSMLKDSFRSSTEQLVKSVEHTTEKNLDQFNFAVEYLSKDPNVLAVDESEESALWLGKNLESMLSSQPEIISIYYASEGGGFHLKPAQDLPADFNPRSRPWYEEAKNAGGETVWIEPYQDVGTGQTVVTVVRGVYGESGFKGVVGIDISIESIAGMMNELKIGDKGYPILLDENLKVITHKDLELIGDELPVPELNEAIRAEESGTVEYMWEENGEDKTKFGVFTTVEDTGWTVLAAMYEDEISEETSSIMKNILFIGVFMLLLSLLASWLFSKKISRNIKSILEAMKKVRHGDLTVNIDVKSEDELKVLGIYIEETLHELGSLIGNIKGVSEDISGAAGTLASTSEETSASADEIANAVEDIARGAQDQAEDAERGARIARHLADRFEQLMSNMEDMEVSAKDVGSANETGLSAIKGLEEKSELTERANNEIGHAIDELNKKTQHIGGILDAIRSISDQTNLLALNASIEAARAGEHGRGFAVVAEEIRKLAEESAKSTDQIRDIVLNIQSDSEKTVESMENVRQIGKEETAAVQEVSKSFEAISSSIDGISSQIELIAESVDVLNADKDEIVSAIENISAVSEETAASSEEVTASVEQQNIAVDEVASAAEKLNDMSKNMSENISKFKID